MFLEIAAVVWIVGSIIYHRLHDPKPPGPDRRVVVPVAQEGGVYPIIYGRCRVTAPVLVWVGKPHLTVDPALYCIDLFFLMGIPFLNGANKIYTIWASDLQLQRFDEVGNHELADLTGDGGDEPATRRAVVGNYGQNLTDSGVLIGGYVEFLNGNDAQQMTAGGFPLTRVAKHMVANETGGIAVNTIPGYRRHLSAFLYFPYVIGGGHTYDTLPESGQGFGWSLGTSPTVPPMQFEVSSYPEGTGLAGNNKVGQEANPADVIWDLLTSESKLAIPFARMDVVSFTACAVKLLAEGHGYSRSIEQVGTAEEHIVDVLKQIDAVLYEDPDDLKLKLKLVRGDYLPSSVTVFTKQTCTVSNWSLSGWTSIPNKVRIVFNDRQLHYKDNSATAQNMANAVGQDGQVHELVLQMPGVCTMQLAETIASRELSARSRPVATCSITVDRAYWRIVPGDVIALSYEEYGISGMLFRVGAVNRGTVKDGGIKLDLIQDFFYAHRDELIGPVSPENNRGGGRLIPLRFTGI